MSQQNLGDSNIKQPQAKAAKEKPLYIKNTGTIGISIPVHVEAGKIPTVVKLPAGSIAEVTEDKALDIVERVIKDYTTVPKVKDQPYVKLEKVNEGDFKKYQDGLREAAQKAREALLKKQKGE
jgi:hypothetical protein